MLPFSVHRKVISDLEKVRERSGLTQRAIAELLQVSESHYSRNIRVHFYISRKVVVRAELLTTFLKKECEVRGNRFFERDFLESAATARGRKTLILNDLLRNFGLTPV